MMREAIPLAGLLADRVQHLRRLESSSIPEPNSGCWLWLGASTSAGYGLFPFGGGRRSQRVGAHRASYTLHCGDIPDGMLVCHRCDNPSCVNPAHLFLGSHGDNAADRNKKGRSKGQAKGASHSRAKITERQAQEVIALAASGLITHAEIAQRLNVSTSIVALIATGASWKHLPRPKMSLMVRCGRNGLKPRIARAARP